MKKLRILEVLIIILTIKITPMAINYAKELRGYTAYGGEYLIPLISFLIIGLLETFYEIKTMI